MTQTHNPATDDSLDWHAAAKEYLALLCRGEYEAQRKAWKRSPQTFRYAPSEYVNDLIHCLNINDEEAFKARKMLSGYASAIGV